MEGGMERRIKSWMGVNGSMDGKMDGWRNGCVEGMNKRLDGGGETHEWIEGWMEEERGGGQTKNPSI